ncbi:hypothetical protein [Flavilitoribacter nigricans]|uniref:Uncharacterized protein n=1 Tax=Flavilitoribacter nigricans (strain ATCC 23147 / DSM 23189 / NBRC 102662 / NCIMB 1420 / SS-2) TaxID=1122177 RepID=A0A2D0NCF2_FLAN2|nr:hypothetical protein [Flavilitoribacter nigricans]PHN06167.1 hypothetical protein CRP01_11320 [Flavilitoribacter nigricans DSM 23189 = NBRC 102662]
MPGLNDLQNINISGRLYGAYQDEPSFQIAGLDGLTGLTELLQYILDTLAGGGAAIAVYTTYQEDFTGTDFALPLAVNNGKLPADNDKIFVFINGGLAYPDLDYGIIRNGAGIADQIQFSVALDTEDILIRFIA